jgi:hypothetical protein
VKFFTEGWLGFSLYCNGAGAFASLRRLIFTHGEAIDETIGTNVCYSGGPAARALRSYACVCSQLYQSKHYGHVQRANFQRRIYQRPQHAWRRQFSAGRFRQQLGKHCRKHAGSQQILLRRRRQHSGSDQRRQQRPQPVRSLLRGEQLHRDDHLKLRTTLQRSGSERRQPGNVPPVGCSLEWNHWRFAALQQ